MPRRALATLDSISPPQPWIRLIRPPRNWPGNNFLQADQLAPFVLAQSSTVACRVRAVIRAHQRSSVEVGLPARQFQPPRRSRPPAVADSVAFIPRCDFTSPMTISLAALSLPQLRQALALKEQIEALQTNLTSILGTRVVPAAAALAHTLERKLSAAARQDLAEAARTRRAKVQADKRRASLALRPPRDTELPLLGRCNGEDLPKPRRVVKRTSSPEACARMEAAVKAR